MKRPNKLIRYLLSGLCVVTSLFAFASCGGEGGSGVHALPFVAKMLGHTLTEYEGVEATCERVGYEAYVVCVKCDYSTYREIPALGHDYVTVDAKAPTCTESGHSAYKECTRSGCDYKDPAKEQLPALGHSLTTMPEEPSTCLHQGYGEYQKCIRFGCDYSEKGNERLPLLEGHEDYITEYNGKEPTCTQDGYADYVICSECKDSTFAVIPATGHTYILDADTATCTQAGIAYYTCQDCNHTKEEASPALGHDCEYVAAKEPTCTEIGWNAYEYCDRKGCDYTTYEELPMLPHDCEQYEGSPADCTTDGWKAYEACKDCLYTTYEKIPALGHSYKDGVCTVCDAYESNLTYYLKEDGTYEIVGIEGECQKKIVIPSTYEGVAVTSIRSLVPVNGFGELNPEGLSALREITIPVSVVKIGKSAFYYCENLTTVRYTGGVADWLKLTVEDELANPLYYAYNLYLQSPENGELEQLTALNVPEDVTKIRDGAFRNCYSLKQVLLPKSVVTVGEEAFYNCVNLQKATVSGSIGRSAFRNCYNMTEITLEENVTAIGDYAFMSLGNEAIEQCEACSNKTGATATPKSDCTCDYTKIEIILPDTVKTVGANAFYNCFGLQKVTLGGVESIGANAFANAKNLKSVVAGTSLKTVGANAFADCDALEKVEISDANAWAGVEFTDNLSNPLYYAKALYMEGKAVESLTIDMATEIKARAFMNCETLVSVTVGSAVTVIGDLAFANCPSIVSVTFEKGSELTSIGNSAFAFCESLTSIVIPQKVTSIGAFAFQGCQALSEAAFENSEGWKTYEHIYDGSASGTLIASAFLKDTAKAAQYLTGTYQDKYWLIVKK